MKAPRFSAPDVFFQRTIPCGEQSVRTPNKKEKNNADAIEAHTGDPAAPPSLGAATAEYSAPARQKMK
jgi:hypothetical protein